jgi:hypothetical protein
MIVNDELENVGNKMVIVKCKVTSHHSLEETEENHGN